jgi:hypothetical protein
MDDGTGPDVHDARGHPDQRTNVLHGTVDQPRDAKLKQGFTERGIVAVSVRSGVSPGATEVRQYSQHRALRQYQQPQPTEVTRHRLRNARADPLMIRLLTQIGKGNDRDGTLERRPRRLVGLTGSQHVWAGPQGRENRADREE